MTLYVDDILMEHPDATLLSKGGQKVVYAIQHRSFGSCVLKIGCASGPAQMERIKREFSTLRSIDSAYFPKVFQFRKHGRDRFSIVEERVNSKTLSEQLFEFKEPLAACQVCAEILSGLKLLWDRRIVHRDIKPENIMVSSDGKVHIIDLGIARLLDEHSLTHDMALMGPCTPVYAAPEQLSNRKDVIDFRCDQFSLGIVLAQLLLAGKHPFQPDVVGSGNTIVENIISNNWAHSNIREAAGNTLHKVVERLLAPEPFQRFRNVETLSKEFNLQIGELQ